MMPTNDEWLESRKRLKEAYDATRAELEVPGAGLCPFTDPHTDARNHLKEHGAENAQVEVAPQDALRSLFRRPEPMPDDREPIGRIDPDTFDVKDDRDPAEFELDPWEHKSIIELKEYLYPDDQTEEEREERTDILVYAGRVTPERFAAEQGVDLDSAPDTLREAPYVLRWYMRRPVVRMQMTTAGPDAPEDEWISFIDPENGARGEVYPTGFITRPGAPAYVWLMNATLYVEQLQLGVMGSNRDALRPELVQLLRRAAVHGPYMRVTLDDDTQREATGAICDSLIRAANQIEDGETEVPLWYGAEPSELPRFPDGHPSAPAPQPKTPPAQSPERNGFFPWASGAPVSEAASALRRARKGWDEQDHEGAPIFTFSQKRPFDVKGQFHIVVPRDDRAYQAAEAEMAQRVLRDFGHRTARLHLACAAYAAEGDAGKYAPVPRDYVYDLLGLAPKKRTDMSRNGRNRRVEEEVENLQKLGVQITVLDGPAGTEKLSLDRVWDLGFHQWGQKRTVDPERTLDTEHWRLLVRPTAWAQLYLHNETGRQFGYFSRALIENIDWHNNPAAGDLAIELLKYVRFQKGSPRDLTVARMLEICQLDNPQTSQEKRRDRQKLERAILEQERWGWEVEWTRWPEAYCPEVEDRPRFPNNYWDGATREDWAAPFQSWKVTFYPPEDLAEMNSRAKQIRESAPHELPARDWSDRIKAILSATHYSQAGLARTLEVSQSAVSRWKNGNRSPGREHRDHLREIESRNGLDGS